NGVTLTSGIHTTSFGTTTGNTWTALQQFSNASSTLFSALQSWFGATATSTFDTAGRLGVLTATPSYALQVTGSGAFSSLVDASHFVATSTSATSTFAGGLTVDSTDFVVDPDAGRVGIGTASPTAPLQVFNSTANTEALKIIGGGGSSQSRLVFGYGYASSITAETTRILSSLSALDFNALSGQPILFSLASDEKMRVHTDGNVGIASTTPWGKLSVTNTGSGPSFVVEDDTSPDSSPFIITASGLVGIGIANPSGVRLEVRDNDVDSIGWGSISARLGRLTWAGDVTRFIADGASQHMGLEAGNAERVRITSAGLVGIGTTTPSTLLSLAGTTGIFASTTATSTFQGGGINLLTAAGNTGCFAVNGTCLSNTASGIVGSGTTGQFPYYAANGTTLTATSTIFVSTASNVGIGTVGPVGVLDVRGANTVSTGVFIGSTVANVGNAIRINGSATNGGTSSIFTDHWLTEGALALGTYTNRANQLFLATTGNVGIGVTSPSYKLDVAGFINTDQYSGYKQAGNTVLYASTTNNTLAVGASSAAAWMSASSTDWRSVAIGPSALGTTPVNATAQNNVAVGYFSLSANTTGSQNTGVGSRALRLNTTGSDNTALGVTALDVNTTGGQNTAIGVEALTANTTGGSNTSLGYQSLRANTTGASNVALGYQALRTATSSSNNVAVGQGAGFGISGATGAVGGSNTLLGYQSGYDITTGSNNTILGQFPTTGGGITTGSNNILLGQDLRTGFTNTSSNQLNIGNLIFGTGLGSGTTLGTGNVGIGTTSPVSKLSVLGESAFAGGASVGIGYAGTAAPSNGLIIQGNVGIG
ncbi:MAG: hypothetical protein AAB921_03255, partial [Patescibacteria group bacterium]